MLQERIGDVEGMVRKLRVAAGAVRQQAAGLIVGNLGEMAVRRILDRHQPCRQLGRRQHLGVAPRDACDAGDIA